MSIKGTVMVECDTVDCQSTEMYVGIEALHINEHLADEGWRFVARNVYCPECVERSHDRDRDGEAFRGGEAAAYQGEQQAQSQRELKR